MNIQRDTVSTGKEAGPLRGALKALMKGNHGPVACPGATGETNVIVCLEITIKSRLKTGFRLIFGGTHYLDKLSRPTVEACGSLVIPYMDTTLLY